MKMDLSMEFVNSGVLAFVVMAFPTAGSLAGAGAGAGVGGDVLATFGGAAGAASWGARGWFLGGRIWEPASGALGRAMVCAIPARPGSGHDAHL